MIARAQEYPKNQSRAKKRETPSITDGGAAN